MMSPTEKALHALEEGALKDLMMGKWPYFEAEAYMAPSNVPTNWRKILEGLDGIVAIRPDMPRQLHDALAAMTDSAEETYCALHTLLFYLRMRASLSKTFALDVHTLLSLLGSAAIATEAEARCTHLPWMGPTGETLWERVVRVAASIEEEFGITVL
jgi:hypothetical protein